MKNCPKCLKKWYGLVKYKRGILCIQYSCDNKYCEYGERLKIELSDEEKENLIRALKSEKSEK